MKLPSDFWKHQNAVPRAKRARNPHFRSVRGARALNTCMGAVCTQELFRCLVRESARGKHKRQETYQPGTTSKREVSSAKAASAKRLISFAFSVPGWLQLAARAQYEQLVARLTTRATCSETVPHTCFHRSCSGVLPTS